MQGEFKSQVASKLAETIRDNTKH